MGTPTGVSGQALPVTNTAHLPSPPDTSSFPSQHSTQDRMSDWQQELEEQLLQEAPELGGRQAGTVDAGQPKAHRRPVSSMAHPDASLFPKSTNPDERFVPGQGLCLVNVFIYPPVFLLPPISSSIFRSPPPHTHLI